MTVIALLELWLPDRPEWTWTRDGQVFNDIIHGLGNEFAAGLGRNLLAILFAVIGGRLAARGGLDLWPTAWPLWGQVLVAVLIVDFCDYWKHRAYHGWALAWPIHALHHNMDRMHVFKGIRLHFLEATIRGLVVYSPLVVLGAPAEVMLWIAALMTFGAASTTRTSSNGCRASSTPCCRPRRPTGCITAGTTAADPATSRR